MYRPIQQTPNGKFAFAPVTLNNKRPSLVDQAFYCWVEGTNPPTHPHWSEAEAKAEAQRLAMTNPGKRVHVMRHVFESIASVSTPTGVQWEQ